MDVRAEVDGRPTAAWDGAVTALDPFSRVRQPGAIDLACDPGGRYRFHAVRLRLHAGEAHLARPADAPKLTTN